MTKEVSFVGLQSATLYSMAPTKTLQVLTDLLGYQIIEEDHESYRLQIHDQLG